MENEEIPRLEYAGQMAGIIARYSQKPSLNSAVLITIQGN